MSAHCTSAVKLSPIEWTASVACGPFVHVDVMCALVTTIVVDKGVFSLSHTCSSFSPAHPTHSFLVLGFAYSLSGIIERCLNHL